MWDEKVSVMNKWSDVEKWLNATNFEKGMEAFKDIPVVDQFFRSLKQSAKGKQDDSELKSYRFKEGKEHIDVLYNLPLHCNKEELKLYVREDYVRIEGLPDDNIEMIKLPRLVKAKCCRAKIVEQELQIRLEKRPRSRKFFEHHIQTS
jgi:HSP20 family molecular chaperone IbpA